MPMTVQSFVCMDMSVCICSGFFYVICMYLQIKCILVCINPLSRIRNTNLISAYFGLVVSVNIKKKKMLIFQDRIFMDVVMHVYTCVSCCRYNKIPSDIMIQYNNVFKNRLFR
jgi:hypothetical protein